MPLRIVNIVPPALSNETNGDTEPSIAVNAANPLRIAVSAFAPDPALSGSAPIFVTSDGGNTWNTVVCLPGGNTTNDISIRFAGVGFGASGVTFLRNANFVKCGRWRAARGQAGVESTNTG